MQDSSKSDYQGACPPDSKRKLLACLRCRMILTTDQFLKLHGCPNCKQAILDFEGLREHTTSNFSGMIAVLGATNAQSSWVCKWNQLRRAKPGIYAIDARQEVTMIVDDDRYSAYDEAQSQQEEQEESYERETTLRDEREVRIKREKLMNR